jgi:FixJ family two-component response regulator
MISTDQLVFIVDDDYRIREALQELLASAGLLSVALGSATDYLAYPKPDGCACLILDVELPDINGLDLQRQLLGSDHPPIIFVSGHGNIPSTVRAMKAGAMDFLTKPFNDEELLRLVQTALTKDRERRIKQAALNSLKQRFLSLTPREREVLPLVVSGLLNKQAAARLGISEVTLQIHRTSVMRKMEADSLADLVRMAGSLDIPLSS